MRRHQRRASYLFDARAVTLPDSTGILADNAGALTGGTGMLMDDDGALAEVAATSSEVVASSASPEDAINSAAASEVAAKLSIRPANGRKRSAANNPSSMISRSVSGATSLMTCSKRLDVGKRLVRLPISHLTGLRFTKNEIAELLEMVCIR